VRRPRYIQMRNYEAMGRIEDIDLGASARADVAVAPAAWGYERNGVGGRLAASAGLRVPAGFAQVGASASGLRTSAGSDSSTVDASLLTVVQPNALHLIVARVAAGRLENQPFGTEYDLGLGYAVRAFPSHAFTGDRYYLVNGEYRWIVLPRFLGLFGFGVAGFVDHGGAWFDGAERRTGTDAGFGFRIGSIRSAGSVIGRLDFAYRFANDREPEGWVVSLGRGFGWQRF
jgi:hemolysin activation/secretion protein